MKSGQMTDWHGRKSQHFLDGRNDVEIHSAGDREFYFDENLWENLMAEALEKSYFKGSLQLREFMDHLEKGIIIRALWKVDGNLKEAAKLLSVKYTTLHEKLKKHHIRIRRNAY